MSVASTPDPGSTQHTEKVQNAVQGMDEFEKVAAEMLQNLTGTEKEKEDEQASEKKASQTDNIAKANAFMLLNSQQAQVAETVVNYLKNIAGASQPQLLPPAQGAKSVKSIPTDATGTGNPWLVGSLTAKLFEIWLTMLPLLMKIKIKEAAFSAMQSVAMQDLAVAGAEAAKKATQKEADNLRLEAQQQFIKAGIAFASMVMTVADKVASQVKSAVESGASAVKDAAGKVGSAAVSVGSSVAGGVASSVAGRGGGGGGGGGEKTGGADSAPAADNNASMQDSGSMGSGTQSSLSNNSSLTTSGSSTSSLNASGSGAGSTVPESQTTNTGAEIGGQSPGTTTQANSATTVETGKNETGGTAPPGETSSTNKNDSANKTATDSGSGKSSSIDNARDFLRGTSKGGMMMQQQSHGSTKATGGSGAPPGMDAQTATQLLNVAGDIAAGVIKLKMADNMMAKAQYDFLAKTFDALYKASEQSLNASQKAQQGASDQIAALFQAMQQFMEKVAAAFTFNR